MKFFANIEPLDDRALDGLHSIEILEIVGRRTKALFKVPNMNRLSRVFADRCQSTAEDNVVTLINAGYLKADFQIESRGVKNIELTDAGWDAIGQQKPFWIGE